MHALFWSLLGLVGLVSANFDMAYQLKQDEYNEKYYLSLYVGSGRVKKNLLVDFEANGTVINYDPFKSNTALIHTDDKENITLYDNTTYEGYLVEDNLCLDSDEDICVERYQFFDVEDKINFTSDPNIKIVPDGVIPLNQFDSLRYPNRRLVNLLEYEDILFNSTLHFDFNLPIKMFMSSEVAPKSYVYFNGIEKSKIRFVDELGEGVVWNLNADADSYWMVNVTDFKWKESTIVRYTYPEQQLVGVLSSSLNSIGLPAFEFENFVIALQMKYPDFKAQGGIIASQTGSCAQYDLGNLTLNLNGTEYRIP